MQSGARDGTSLSTPAACPEANTGPPEASTPGAPCAVSMACDHDGCDDVRAPLLFERTKGQRAANTLRHGKNNAQVGEVPWS